MYKKLFILLIIAQLCSCSSSEKSDEDSTEIKDAHFSLESVIVNECQAFSLTQLSDIAYFEKNCTSSEQGELKNMFTKSSWSIDQVLDHISDVKHRKGVANGTTHWMLGDTISFYLYDKSENSNLGGENNALAAVIKGFDEWNEVGLSIFFKRINNPDKAIMHVSFIPNSTSSTGRLVSLEYQETPKAITINFGCTLSTNKNYNIVLHEIGHAIGLQHEHQHPKDTLDWDTVVLRNTFENKLSSGEIYNQIIRKKGKGTGTSSKPIFSDTWDSLSVMNYSFPKGAIKNKPYYKEHRLPQRNTISENDKKMALQMYPKLEPHNARFIELNNWIEIKQKHGTTKHFSFQTNNGGTFQFCKALGPKRAYILVFKKQENGSYTLHSYFNFNPNQALYNLELDPNSKYLFTYRAAPDSDTYLDNTHSYTSKLIIKKPTNVRN